MLKILLVDDDVHALDSTRKILEMEGHQVVLAVDGEDALHRFQLENNFNLVITDVRMPKLGGIDFLKTLIVMKRDIPFILMTAYGRVDEAVWAMKQGAVDFLQKPFKKRDLISAVEIAMKNYQANLNAKSLQQGDDVSGAGWIGRSGVARKIAGFVEKMAPTDTTLLITGESGVGKEVVSRMLHSSSLRKNGPFVAVNCGAIPESLMESELFGYERGAFSGAVQSKPGLFETAHNGTLLLDEIGDLPYNLQVKLLRVIQDSQVRRLGSNRSIEVNVRLIAATNHDLRMAAERGTFRQDLLFRLAVVELNIPSLRERIEDIPDFSRHFLNVFSEKHKKKRINLSSEALDVLMHHSWPGNIRELENALERAVIWCGGSEILVDDLPKHLVAQALNNEYSAGDRNVLIPIGMALKDVEDLMIRKTLEATAGDKNMTARLLGVNERTIYRKIKVPNQD